MSESTWVILVNYRGAADTIECVDSLGVYAADATVVVVENGSGDDSAARIRAAHPSTRVVVSHTNLGFTGGSNLGIREALDAGAKHVWLLNNDTVILPGAIVELQRALDVDDSVGIVSPRIDYYDELGMPWFIGARLDLSRGEAVHDNSVIPDDVVELPWITGCAMFCRADMLRQLGGFDDRYFLNWEDVDLSLRAAKLGWKLKLAPRAVIRHKVSRSLSRISTQATYYWVRNRVLCTQTHADPTATRRVRRANIREALRAAWNGEPHGLERLWATFRAHRDARRGTFGPAGE